MKRNLLIFILTLAFNSIQAQAHLGATEYEIKSKHPGKTWTTKYTDDGVKYISTDMVYGNFTYYFNKETKLTDLCAQFPFNNATMNGQIEAYNKKYVITSDRSWTAYLDSGGIMYIELLYDKENKISYFLYKDYK